MEPVEEAHYLQIVSRHRPWQVVHAATADAQGLRLLRDGQFMLAHDHRLALSKPALPSATSKKSFSSVSSPILMLWTAPPHRHVSATDVGAAGAPHDSQEPVMQTVTT